MRVLVLAMALLLAACQGEPLEFEQARKLVSYSMRDPSSTQFRNLTFSDKEKSTVCGEVNSKNGFGAYVGFKPFHATPIEVDGKVFGPSFIDVDTAEAGARRVHQYLCGSALRASRG